MWHYDEVIQARSRELETQESSRAGRRAGRRTILMERIEYQVIHETLSGAFQALEEAVL